MIVHGVDSLLKKSLVGLFLAAACLAGCGGLSSQGGPSSVLPQAQRPAGHGDMLYVTDTVSQDVYVFSYPSGKLLQTLSGFQDPAGECVDAGGDVFIANTGASDVIEYAHGGTSPKATLKDAGFFPVGCSVDPTTGNLAVTNFPIVSDGTGTVVIYKHAKGRPTGHYTDPAISDMLLCGYDGSGNLFVDGLTRASAFEFAELRAGATKLTKITLNQSIASAGAVQWDGTYVAVGDQSTNTIYQFSISGKKGTMVGSTALGGASQVFQFWIDGAKVIGPDSGASNVGIWKYPAGGSEIKTIGGLYAPLGATVSKGG